MSLPRHHPTRRVLALLPVLACSLLAPGMTGQAAAAPTPSYSLAVSMNPDRSSAQSLSGKSFSQASKIHVFTTPTTSARRVRFYLDDATMSRAPRSIETTAPFDFNSTAADGTAIGFDLASVSVASHTITAAVETTNGRTRVVSASFAVTSSTTTTTPPPPPPPPPPTTTADTTNPTPASLSATGGDQSVKLDWTAATDNVGVTRYEVWMDSGYVSGVSSSTRSYTVSGLAAGVSHSFRVVAYDAAGNYANSNSVSAAAVSTTTTTVPPPTTSSGTAAAFPSALRASGRNIVDENGYVMPTLRGFNMHVGPGFTWDQSHFDAIKAIGGKINRAVLHWDQFEMSQGVVNTTAIANLDLHIARAQAAGIYTMLELHLNVGRVPSWTSGVSGETAKYAAYGQTLTQYLANRYGNPASPKYTKAVVGFGLNEPPIEDNAIRNGNNSIPWLEGIQRKMISWMRADAPKWIGFVAYGYAQATPIYDDTWQDPDAIDASPTAYDSVGGNVIIDLHDYNVGCNNTNPSCDGRQYNGMIWPTYQGGPMLTVGGSYTSSSLLRSQQAAYMKPYKTFSEQAGIPLMLGEWGWTSGDGETGWITDKKVAWANGGAAIEIQWNYDVSSANTIWAARPGGTWRPSVSKWLAPTA